MYAYGVLNTEYGRTLMYGVTTQGELPTCYCSFDLLSGQATCEITECQAGISPPRRDSTVAQRATFHDVVILLPNPRGLSGTDYEVLRTDRCRIQMLCTQKCVHM